MPEPTYDDWMQSRPACVRRTLERFPPNTKFRIDGKLHYLVGAQEADPIGEGFGPLLLSPINPMVDYDAAIAARIVLCADHFDDLRLEDDHV